MARDQVGACWTRIKMRRYRLRLFGQSVRGLDQPGSRGAEVVDVASTSSTQRFEVIVSRGFGPPGMSLFAKGCYSPAGPLARECARLLLSDLEGHLGYGASRSQRRLTVNETQGTDAQACLDRQRCADKSHVGGCHAVGFVPSEKDPPVAASESGGPHVPLGPPRPRAAMPGRRERDGVSAPRAGLKSLLVAGLTPRCARNAPGARDAERPARGDGALARGHADGEGGDHEVGGVREAAERGRRRLRPGRHREGPLRGK